MKETRWFNVFIWLKGVSNPLVVSMTEEEVTRLKNTKLDAQRFYFKTEHKLSDKLFIDVTEIVAILEKEENGDD